MGHEGDRCCLCITGEEPRAPTQKEVAPGPELKSPTPSPASYKPLLPWPVSLPWSSDALNTLGKGQAALRARHYTKSPGAQASLLLPSREQSGRQGTRWTHVPLSPPSLWLYLRLPSILLVTRNLPQSQHTVLLC